jgi:4,5-DOPA dioxygenase extradiol
LYVIAAMIISIAPGDSIMTTYFISHGAPDLAIVPSEAADFMRRFGLGGHKPRAILMVSAHYTAEHPTLSADLNPEMIYDFGGFDPALRQIVYPAPGAPDVAAEAAEALRAAGFSAQLEHHRGYDHGTWVPLVLMHPQADIPVVQL